MSIRSAFAGEALSGYEYPECVCREALSRHELPEGCPPESHCLNMSLQEAFAEKSVPARECRILRNNEQEVGGLQKILLLEDDISLVDGLTYSLEKNGFEVEVVRTIKEAEKILAVREDFVLLLFDVTLPDGNGFGLCERLRKAGDRTPVIFLTASDEETSVIRGLDCGGDDYITKPFKLGELCSRIRALLRRSAGQSTEDSVLRSGDVVIDLTESKVLRDGQVIDFTGAEYRLLCLFLKNRGRVLTRTLILDKLWDGAGSFVDDNTLSVYVRRLREKLEDDPSVPVHLKTVRGVGYKWEEGHGSGECAGWRMTQ